MAVMDSIDRRTVLITGGRGFIGRATAEALRGAGYRVISADINPAKMDREHVTCDVANLAEVRNLFHTESFDAIVHLAAILPTAAQCDPSRANQVNVEGSLNLLDAVKEFGVRRFVFGSSLSVYGTYAAEQGVTEADRTAPEDVYGSAKVYVERVGEAYRQSHGLDFVSLRIGRVVGPGARSRTSAWRSQMFECLDGESWKIVVPYAESERVLLVHVEDVGRMLLELVRAPQLRHTVYNAACESMIVGELKSQLEELNPRVRVTLGGDAVVGNPRRVDWSRMAEEFGIEIVPMFDQLRLAANPSQ
jgi:nucleoside-diphosphate-sugar epimerase